MSRLALIIVWIISLGAAAALAFGGGAYYSAKTGWTPLAVDTKGQEVSAGDITAHSTSTLTVRLYSGETREYTLGDATQIVLLYPPQIRTPQYLVPGSSVSILADGTRALLIQMFATTSPRQ